MWSFGRQYLFCFSEALTFIACSMDIYIVYPPSIISFQFNVYVMATSDTILVLDPAVREGGRLLRCFSKEGRVNG